MLQTVLLVFALVALAVAVLFIVGLLRSHAEILRRLTALESSDDAERPPLAVHDGASRPASDIVGETLSGDFIKLDLSAGSPTTLLAFMSSGCAHCGPLWAGLGGSLAARSAQPARVVVVAKDRSSESVSRLRELGGAVPQLVLSSGAWADYEVPGSPHFVLVDGGSGRVAGRGTAGSWEQITSMVTQALADTDAHVLAPRQRMSNSTRGRAARAHAALLASGIEPGHPSLHPGSSPAGEREQP